MKSIFILLLSTFFLNPSSNIDNLIEYTGVSVSTSDSSEKELEVAKISHMVTETTKTTIEMKVKGVVSSCQLKKGKTYDFYVRYTSKERGKLIIVKFDVEKDKRVLRSVESLLNPEKNNKSMTFVQIVSSIYDNKKNIMKVNASDPLTVGSYAILCAENDGKTIKASGLNCDKAMLFDIVE